MYDLYLQTSPTDSSEWHVLVFIELPWSLIPCPSRFIVFSTDSYGISLVQTLNIFSLFLLYLLMEALFIHRIKNGDWRVHMHESTRIDIQDIQNTRWELRKNCFVQQIQLDPGNSNSVISNSPLFRTKTHFPWTCPSVINYWLFRTIFRFPWRFEIAGFNCMRYFSRFKMALIFFFINSAGSNNYSSHSLNCSLEYLQWNIQ